MILDSFDDWITNTATFYKRSTAKDSSGQSTDSFTLTGSCFTVWKWIDNSVAQSVSDRFINNEFGKIAFAPNGLTLNTGDYLLIGTEKYYIVGVDPDMLSFDEVALVDYRREYGFRA